MQSPAVHDPTAIRRAEGGLATAGAFVLWGLFPIYWKALVAVDPVEIIAHRIVWSLAFTALLLVARRRWREIGPALRSWRAVARLATSAALLSVNWLIYVYGVNSGRILETSLGYFITPLANVVLGMVFLRERLRPAQAAALVLATAAVVNQVLASGGVPWIGLSLAVTFGFYGLLRKTATLDSLPGLAAETLLLTVPAGAYLAATVAGGTAALGRAGALDHALLLGTGVVTAVPLLLFGFGARRIRLTTVGLLQYLAPSGAFLLGVFAYGEPFDRTRVVTFALIWTALAVFAADGLLRASVPGQARRRPGARTRPAGPDQGT